MGFAPVEEQLEVILRGVVDAPAQDELRKKVARSRETGTPLVVKAGFDPTAPDLHLGHTVLLTKMRQLQDLGHRVVFLIGDFTAMIGDPTGRNKTRQPLTREDVVANAETYKAQVFKVLDEARTEVVFNATWLDALGTVGVIELAAKYTVARMMEREDFKTRFQGGQSISVHEFLYPLMQGYDSVALKADLELGGSDQLFNLLVGRQLMREYGQEPQCVLTMPLLEGTDASWVDGEIVGKKMSKSLGNYVGIDEAPFDMFGKLMSISDEVMWRYQELLSLARSAGELAALQAAVASGAAHPRDVKVDFAKEIIARYHDAAAADDAADRWLRQYSAKEVPDDMPSVTVAADDDGAASLIGVLREASLVDSGGHARRLIKQGAVAIDGDKVRAVDHRVPSGGPYVFKVGKHGYARVTVG